MAERSTTAAIRTGKLTLSSDEDGEDEEQDNSETSDSDGDSHHGDQWRNEQSSWTPSQVAAKLIQQRFRGHLPAGELENLQTLRAERPRLYSQACQLYHQELRQGHEEQLRRRAALLQSSASDHTARLHTRHVASYEEYRAYMEHNGGSSNQAQASTTRDAGTQQMVRSRSSNDSTLTEKYESIPKCFQMYPDAASQQASQAMPVSGSSRVLQYVYQTGGSSSQGLQQVYRSGSSSSRAPQQVYPSGSSSSRHFEPVFAADSGSFQRTAISPATGSSRTTQPEIIPSSSRGFTPFPEYRDWIEAQQFYDTYESS